MEKYIVVTLNIRPKLSCQLEVYDTVFTFTLYFVNLGTQTELTFTILSVALKKVSVCAIRTQKNVGQPKWDPPHSKNCRSEKLGSSALKKLSVRKIGIICTQKNVGQLNWTRMHFKMLLYLV